MTETILVTGPTFQQVNAGRIRVSATGQANSAAVPLGDLLAGTQPSYTPNTGIVSHAGGTKALATPVAAGLNEVSTTATAADSLLLPLAVAGLEVIITNGGVASAQVFGAGTDTINAVATATGVAQGAGLTAIYFCTKTAPAGTWRRLLSA